MGYLFILLIIYIQHHITIFTRTIAFILSSARLFLIICRPATTNRCYPGPQRMHVGCKVKMPTCCGVDKRPNGGKSYLLLAGPTTSKCGRPRPGYNHHQHSTRICRRNIRFRCGLSRLISP